MNRKRRRRKLLIVIGILFLCMIFFGMNRFSQKGSEHVDKTEVYRYELMDFLKIADLSEDEIQQIFLPDLSEILTGADEKQIYETLGLTGILKKRTHLSDALTRKQWCQGYEAVYQALGHKDDIEILTIQYLGHVPSEKRIVTDRGNFNTNLPESFWEYGAYYQIYCCKNDLYGVKCETQKAREKTEAQKEKEAHMDTSEKEKTTSKAFIRVLLTNDNDQEPLRKDFQILCKSDFTIDNGTQSKACLAGTVVSGKELKEFFKDGIHSVTLTPKKNKTLYVKQEDSHSWSDAYRGIINIHKNKSGYWLVNILPAEEYLLGVVPGEMPERFHMEALKAQAVCARTFAYQALERKKYNSYGADVDDSVNSQVYNKNGENKKTSQAVADTRGLVLCEENQKNLADIYYYSASCGYTAGLEAWGSSAKKPYLTSVSTQKTPKKVTDWGTYLKKEAPDAYDDHSRYYRWKAVIRLPKNQELKLVKRETSGVVTDICYVNGTKKKHVKTEHDIRKDLGAYVVKLTDASGKAIDTTGMLPSAFFTIEKGKPDGMYLLYGGGYGHGIGMSQYGADGMGKSGMNYKEILQFYFPGTCLKEK